MSYPVACICTLPPLRPSLQHIANERDALALSDALEAMIDAGEATPADREACYDAIRQWERETAAYAYARASVAGRLAQVRGLAAAELIAELERYARRSLQLNPGFREGAAARMLGTLYVLAPPAMVKHGDSEKGLELLEELVRRYPDTLENRLRLAEGYIALDDHEPAYPHLCLLSGKRSALKGDDERLFGQLLETVGKDALDCDEAD